MAKYRWILTGTPVPNSPFDVYSQIRFLQPDFWKQHNIPNFSVFKRYFGILVLLTLPGRRPFWECQGYQNLEELQRILATITTRITKEECLDLPPKVYQKVYFELPPSTRKIYDDLRKNFMVELEGGAEITAPLAIVRLTRLQQITCGFMSTDGSEEVTLFEKNPRLAALTDLVEDLDSALIWARYKKDIDLIVEALGSENCVRIDGSVPDHERADLVEQFQSGQKKYFVGNPAAISEGVTLHRTANGIFYSNGFKLGERIQAEDRLHRIGQKRSVNIWDLSAEDTVDDRIVEALRDKKNVASMVTGDELKEWL
jgi:SNF2 family DNA or RNA helicase